MLRRLASVTLAFGVLVGLAACGAAPEPAPVESEAAFASDAEAFAAAEATYRAYVDALNLQRSGEQASNPQVYLRGEALDLDIDTRRYLSESGLTILGSTSIAAVKPAGIEPNRSLLTVEVCIDSTHTRVVDLSGTDHTPPDRVNRIPARVRMQLGTSGFVITESESSAETTC